VAVRTYSLVGTPLSSARESGSSPSGTTVAASRSAIASATAVTSVSVCSVLPRSCLSSCCWVSIQSVTNSSIRVLGSWVSRNWSMEAPYADCSCSGRLAVDSSASVAPSRFCDGESFEHMSWHPLAAHDTQGEGTGTSLATFPRGDAYVPYFCSGTIGIYRLPFHRGCLAIEGMACPAGGQTRRCSDTPGTGCRSRDEEP